MNDTPDVRTMHDDLVKAGWIQASLMLYKAPCGCLFRGPYRAWVEMNGTHLADHVASGLLPAKEQGRCKDPKCPQAKGPAHYHESSPRRDPKRR